MNGKTPETERRQKLLISKQFQYEYIAFRLATVLVAINIVIITALLTMGGPAKLGFTVAHGAVIGVVELLIICVIGWIGLKRSHAIVGPVFALEREMARVTDGDLTVVLQLRGSDRFQDTAKQFNAMTSSLKERVDGISAASGSLEQSAGSGSELASEIANLRETIDRFQTSSDEHEGASDEG